MKNTILFMYLLLLASCTTQEYRTEKKNAELINFDNPRTTPIWSVMNKKTAFVFTDHQNLIIPMRSSGIDTVLLSRTNIIRSNGDNYFGEWIIPSSDDRFDTTFVDIIGVDTTTTIIETLVYPMKAFKLKEYKELTPY